MHAWRALCVQKVGTSTGTGKETYYWQWAKTSFSATIHPALLPCNDIWNNPSQRGNHLCVSIKRVAGKAPSTMMPASKGPLAHPECFLLRLCWVQALYCPNVVIESTVRLVAIQFWSDCNKFPFLVGLEAYGAHEATPWDKQGDRMPPSPCLFITLFC